MRIEATMNCLGNAKNMHQTNVKRVLAVCSAGLLRSPTVANVLHKEYGYNTRACGATSEYALIPLSEVLIHWADEIVFVNKDNYLMARRDYPELEEGVDVIILNIPDRYEWNDPELQQEIIKQYQNAEIIEGALQ